MRLLILTDRDGGGKALLPSLEFLDHAVREAPLEPGAVTRLAEVQMVVVDATAQLRDAAACCRAAAVAELARPVLVVISQEGLAALRPSWGFDDWLLPDVSVAELETRLRLASEMARGRRADRAASVGDLVVDEHRYQVRLRGEPLDLTYKEFELLKTLISSPGRVFSRELLLQEVWGYDYLGGSRTIDVHVRRLRAKLGPEYEWMIGTVRGVGYRLVPENERSGGERSAGADG